MMERDTILSVHKLVKSYSGVTVLKGVDIDFRRGEVHALVGENGAGKSTLIKSISGAIRPDSGIINIDGEEFTHLEPLQAIEKGVGVIYQELNLVPPLSVAENIFLGHPILNGILLDKKEMARQSREIFDRFGLSIDPNEKVSNLTVAYMQLVEIAKSISRKAKVIVMDEPTGPLTLAETEILMKLIAQLKENGITIIYISHRLEEIFAISDRVTVMRDGEKIATLNTADTNRQELIALMVGRKMEEVYPERKGGLGEVALELDHVYGNGDRDISFQVRQGEIVGLAGLVGAGRTELAQVIFGAAKLEKGEIRVFGEKVNITSPSVAIDYGIGLIPEDRKIHGLLQEYAIGWNISLPIIKRLSKATIVDRKKESETIDNYMGTLRVKSTGPRQKVKFLSGGNQQKIVVSKWLATDSRILIFDEPTRGIDVGTKQEIYRLMNELAEQGMAILMISSDMEELLGMADRLVVLYEGEQTGEIARKDYTQDRVLTLAMGKDA